MYRRLQWLLLRAHRHILIERLSANPKLTSQCVVWSNVRFNSNIIEMRWKPQFNCTPNAYNEREVPVPDELLKIPRNPSPFPACGAGFSVIIGFQHGQRTTRYPYAPRTQTKCDEGRIKPG